MGMDSYILTDISQENLSITDNYLAYWRRNYTLDDLMEGVFYQRGGHGNRNNLPMPITIENLHWLRDRLTDDDVVYDDRSTYSKSDFFQRMEETIKGGTAIYYYVSY